MMETIGAFSFSQMNKSAMAPFSRLQTNNVMIMGDLNASAPYVHANDWISNRLRTSPGYKW